ncbi:hypothetical protein EPO34_02260 [Patescibacteria group bacterium]|nr:MAG: hypothetical protein EPO34_02260 [Patescibacteria group bacterium]
MKEVTDLSKVRHARLMASCSRRLVKVSDPVEERKERTHGVRIVLTFRELTFLPYPFLRELTMLLVDPALHPRMLWRAKLLLPDLSDYADAGGQRAVTLRTHGTPEPRRLTLHGMVVLTAGDRELLSCRATARKIARGNAGR